MIFILSVEFQHLYNEHDFVVFCYTTIYMGKWWCVEAR